MKLEIDFKNNIINISGEYNLLEFLEAVDIMNIDTSYWKIVTKQIITEFVVPQVGGTHVTLCDRNIPTVPMQPYIPEQPLMPNTPYVCNPLKKVYRSDTLNPDRV